MRHAIIDTTDNGTNGILAVADSENAAWDAYYEEAGDDAPDGDARAILITDALAATDCRTWHWLPGLQGSVAGTADEAGA